MSLVLDSSAALAWLFPDETSPAIQAVFDQLIRAGAWVPSLWRLEIANSLQMAVKRRRVSERFRDQPQSGAGYAIGFGPWPGGAGISAGGASDVLLGRQPCGSPTGVGPDVPLSQSHVLPPGPCNLQKL